MSAESKLVEIFASLDKAASRSDKEQLLHRAEACVCNEMTKCQLRKFFIDDPTAPLVNMFAFEIWTPSLDDVNGIVEFIQPYAIIERLFACFDSLPELLLAFETTQLAHLLEQRADERVKHICVQQLTKHAAKLGTSCLLIYKPNVLM
jgi:hypothetical protein